MKGIAAPSLLVCVFAGFLQVGCSPAKVTVKIAYDRPAEIRVPSAIKQLAIAEFGAGSRTEKRWGEVAADTLASALDAYNKQYHRYTLYDRKRLKAIMDERDLQLLISDAGSATRVGKIAEVDAMIYGSVNVIHRDETGTRRTFDPLSQSFKTRSYRKRYCLAAVNFTMDNVGTSRTIATVTATREYDSEKDKEQGNEIGRALGFGGDKLPPTDHVINKLIRQCVEEILTKISPHQVVVEERLERGESKFVATGNEFAGAGEYADALEMYRRALTEKPDDHGAMFNAGVVCEAMGNFKEAGDYYSRAVEANPNRRYIHARRRVRQALEARADQ